MSRKLHRGRTRDFHKRRFPVKAIVWILAAALIIPASYFGAKYMLEERPEQAESSSPSASSVSGGAAGSSAPPAVSEPEAPEEDGAVRAVYLPLSTLRDAAGRDTALSAAASAGFNAVLFDLKGSDGRLAYVSATPLALQAQSAADGALPLEDLKNLLQAVKDKGMKPIARLYAFQDPYAPSRLPTAKIAYAGHEGWTWYDNDPDNGGKPWLNPYLEDARRYITDLLAELKAAGLEAAMLDGVQFPARTSSSALTAEQETAAAKAQALAGFVAQAEEAMGDGELLLSMPGQAALGIDTTVYGGNPVTFGAPHAAPVLMPATLGNKLTIGEETIADPAAHPYDAVKAALSQIQLRLQVIDEAERPALIPWLQGYDCTAADMKEQIRAVTETLGQNASYIVYNAAGTYDFAGLA